MRWTNSRMIGWPSSLANAYPMCYSCYTGDIELPFNAWVVWCSYFLLFHYSTCYNQCIIYPIWSMHGILNKINLHEWPNLWSICVLSHGIPIRKKSKFSGGQKPSLWIIPPIGPPKPWKMKVIRPQEYLVGGWTNPFEKYARQIGSFPQVGMKIKNIWNHRSCRTHRVGTGNHRQSIVSLVLWALHGIANQWKKHMRTGKTRHLQGTRPDERSAN